MKLYLVILLAILSTAFAGKQRSQKCKNRTKNVRGIFQDNISVQPPDVSGWGKIQVSLNTLNGRSSRTVAIEANNCEFRGSPSVTLNFTEVVDGNSPAIVGDVLTILAFDKNNDTRSATNSITITSNGGGCAAFCYLVSSCTHYNFGDNSCTLFSSKNRVTHFSALVRRGNRKCGLKAASTTLTNSTVFTQSPAGGNIRRGDDCMFTEQPFAREINVNDEADCARTCNNLASRCNAYEFFVNDKTCLYKKNPKIEDAFISSAGFQTGSTTNRNLRCGAKQN